MRRLSIGFSGASSALEAVRQELEQYGHISGNEGVDLCIDDGDQSVQGNARPIPTLSLRLGVGPITDYGLPALQLRAYRPDRKLLAVLDIADEPSGKVNDCAGESSANWWNGPRCTSAASRETLDTSN